MEVPQVDIPVIGGGLLIAGVATIHVFVANFIVGGSLGLIVLERRGEEAVARRWATTLLVTTAVAGSVTGVGIWFAILGVAPRATIELVHVFFWPLVAEYAAFVVEIVAMAAIVYGWERRRRRPWEIAAAAAAWASLAIINGLLSFMLSSGDWPETRALSDAFFNPTYFPSLLHRALGCIAVTGIGGLVFASFLPDDGRRAGLTRLFAKAFVIATLLQGIAGPLYLHALREEQSRWVFGYSITLSMMWGGAIGLAVLLCAYVGFQGIRLGRMGRGSAVLSAVLLLSVIGMMEATREAVRRPWLIDRHMYSNQIRVAEVDGFNRHGILTLAPGTPSERRGEVVFRIECAACHTTGGFVGIKYSISGRTADELDRFLEKEISRFHPFMPVFIGTPEERRELAEYLGRMNR